MINSIKYFQCKKCLNRVEIQELYSHFLTCSQEANLYSQQTNNKSIIQENNHDHIDQYIFSNQSNNNNEIQQSLQINEIIKHYGQLNSNQNIQQSMNDVREIKNQDKQQNNLQIIKRFEEKNGDITKIVTIMYDKKTKFTHQQTIYDYPDRIQDELLRQQGELNNQETIKQRKIKKEQEKIRQQEIEDQLKKKNECNKISSLNNYQEITFKNRNNLQEDYLQCVICWTKYKDNEKIALLECCHRFHIQCLQIWLKQKSICPQCKHPL